MKNVLP